MAEVTSELKRANAQTVPPKRFLTFFVPGGCFENDFWPVRTSDTDFTLSSILQPLAPFKNQMLILDGIDVPTMAEGFGHPHARGMAALLTGVSLPKGPYDFFIGGPAGFPDSTSLDHVVGNRIGVDNKYKTLEFGVFWPTYQNGALPTNIISYSGPGQPAPPMADPYEAYLRLFSDVGATTEQAAATQLRNRKTRMVLDATAKEFGAIRPLVGVTDQQRLDEHLQRLQEIGRSLDVTGSPLSATCHKPTPGAHHSGPRDLRCRRGSWRIGQSWTSSKHQLAHSGGRKADDGHAGPFLRLRLDARGDTRLDRCRFTRLFPLVGARAEPSLLSTLPWRQRARDDPQLVHAAARVLARATCSHAGRRSHAARLDRRAVRN